MANNKVEKTKMCFYHFYIVLDYSPLVIPVFSKNNMTTIFKFSNTLRYAKNIYYCVISRRDCSKVTVFNFSRKSSVWCYRKLFEGTLIKNSAGWQKLHDFTKNRKMTHFWCYDIFCNNFTIKMDYLLETKEKYF